MLNICKPEHAVINAKFRQIFGLDTISFNRLLGSTSKGSNVYIGSTSDLARKRVQIPRTPAVVIRLVFIIYDCMISVLTNYTAAERRSKRR